VSESNSQLVPADSGTGALTVTGAGQGKLRDALDDVRQLWGAVQQMEASGRAHDVDVTLRPVAEFSGTTAAEALRAVADFAATSGHVEIHSIAWARVRGPVADVWDYRATLLVSYPDARGETTGATHHETRPDR
jgi:hypothetical protein